MLSSQPIITVNPKSLSYSLISKSVDKSLKEMESHPDVIKFLSSSSLGLEYVSFELNHGDQLYITVHK